MEDEDTLDKCDKLLDAILASQEAKIAKAVPVHRAMQKRSLDLDKGKKSRKKIKKNVESSKDRLLEINRYCSSRNFGIWIQCTKCHKWRKVMDYEEEHQVPNNWYCSMASSGINSCDVPEKIEEKEFPPARFVPGSIVWAKLDGYPWWPAMVEVDPDIEEYYWVEDNGSLSYNVTFLDDKVSRAWVAAPAVCSYLEPPKLKHSNARFMKPYIIHLVQKAENRAKEAIYMSIKERLENFSFARLYKGKWGEALHEWSESVNIDDDTDSEEATAISKALNKDDDERMRDMLLKELANIESLNSDSDYNSDTTAGTKSTGTTNGSNNPGSSLQSYQVQQEHQNETLEHRSEVKEQRERLKGKVMPKDIDVPSTGKIQNETVESFNKFLSAADNYIQHTNDTTSGEDEEIIATNEQTSMMNSEEKTGPSKIGKTLAPKTKKDKKMNSEERTALSVPKKRGKTSAPKTKKDKKMNSEEKTDLSGPKKRGKTSALNTKKGKNIISAEKTDLTDTNKKVITLANNSENEKMNSEENTDTSETIMNMVPNQDKRGEMARIDEEESLNSVTPINKKKSDKNDKAKLSKVKKNLFKPPLKDTSNESSSLDEDTRDNESGNICSTMNGGSPLNSMKNTTQNENDTLDVGFGNNGRNARISPLSMMGKKSQYDTKGTKEKGLKNSKQNKTAPKKRNIKRKTSEEKSKGAAKAADRAEEINKPIRKILEKNIQSSLKMNQKGVKIMKTNSHTKCENKVKPTKDKIVNADIEDNNEKGFSLMTLDDISETDDSDPFEAD